MQYIRFLALLTLILAVAAGFGCISNDTYTDQAGNLSEYETEHTETDSNKKESNKQDDSTNERYVNMYRQSTPPNWKPTEEFKFRGYVGLPYEFTRYPDRDPTRGDLDAAWELYNRSFETAKEEGYFSFEESVVTDFGRNSNIGLKDIENKYIASSGNHYLNIKYFSSEESLAPNKPEFLVYYNSPKNNDDKILAGYMYAKKPSTDSEGKQIAGPLTVWHSHKRSLEGDTRLNHIVNKSEDFGSINQLTDYYGFEFGTVEEYNEKMGNETFEMIHVWFIEHPEGPFATRMAIPPEYLKEPEKMSENEFKDYAMKKYNRYFKER